MQLKKRDLRSTRYEAASQAVIIRLPHLVSDSGGVPTLVPASVGPVQSARENFESRLTSSRPPSKEMLAAVRSAMSRLEARRNEDVDDWSAKLASDLVCQLD